MKDFGLVAGIIMLALFVGCFLQWFSTRLQRREFHRRWELCKLEAGRIVQGVKDQFPGCEGAMNAVTTEPGLRQATSAYRNITREDYLDALDRIDPGKTPVLSMCPNEVKLKAVDRVWNVDSFPSPKGAVGRADNQTVAAGDIRDWSTNIRKMGNIGQGFSESFGVGWIAGELPVIPGVGDPMSYAEAGADLLIKTHMEAAFASFDQVAVYDAGVYLGAVGAGYLKLTASAGAYTSASAYAIGKPTDIHSAPASATITGALSATHSRAMWKNLAYALRTAAKQSGDWMVVAGLSLRQAITDLTVPVTTTTVNGATSGTGVRVGIAAEQVRVYTRAESDSVLGASVDIIQTDFGRFIVTDSDYLGTTTTTSTGGALSAVNSSSAERLSAAFVGNPSAGLVIKRGNIWKTWGITPFTEELGNDGGSKRFDRKCLAMLGVKNPILAGTLNLS